MTSYILMTVLNLVVHTQEFDSLESCKFAGKSFMSLTYGKNYVRDYRCMKK
jgi:hypothetical protein